MDLGSNVLSQVLLSLRSPTRTVPLIQSSLESEPTADGDTGTAGAETQMCLSLTNTLPHVYRGMTQYLAIKQPDSLLHSSVFACLISLFSRSTQCRTVFLAVSRTETRAVARSCPQSCRPILSWFRHCLSLISVLSFCLLIPTQSFSLSCRSLSWLQGSLSFALSPDLSTVDNFQMSHFYCALVSWQKTAHVSHQSIYKHSFVQ